MKLIEAMKQIKDLQRKADDLKDKVKANCALTSMDTPPYGSDQAGQVRRWVQSYEDILKEILRLRIAIQKTNLETEVTIDFDGKPVTKTIAEWVHRRRELAARQGEIWACLTDRGIKEGIIKTQSQQEMEVKIVRFFDPAERDRNRELYAREPNVIDARLEVVNAVTDLIE